MVLVMQSAEAGESSCSDRHWGLSEQQSPSAHIPECKVFICLASVHMQAFAEKAA